MDTERMRPSLQPTGDPRVDQAIADLAAIDEMPLGERPAALEAVHGRLREILGELGGPGRPAGSGVPGGPPRPGEPGRRGEQGELDGGRTPHPGAGQPGPPRPGAGGDPRR